MAKIPYASVVGILMWNMLCTWPNIDKYKNAKKYSMFSFFRELGIKKGKRPKYIKIIREHRKERNKK